ncbi:MAG TPA: LPXTG cell wall anchor domain-containing protein [Bacillota bacterium]|jgi:LPXTG-motif cell wall-anchored protein|nr:LPXTG cell wall anchor domain-containing protein [Bacillota bacterium]HPZ21974.1 LPXTG cell wall anchor domain-containing protein [Bacillota bacterium]
MWFRTRWWYSPGQTIAIILGVLALIALLAWLLARRKK